MTVEDQVIALRAELALTESVIRAELALVRAENEELHTLTRRYLGPLLERLVAHAGIDMSEPVDTRKEVFRAMVQTDPEFLESL
jgi:hypothetical protein